MYKSLKFNFIPALRAGRSAEASLALRAHSDPRLRLGARYARSRVRSNLVSVSIRHANLCQFVSIYSNIFELNSRGDLQSALKL